MFMFYLPDLLELGQMVKKSTLHHFYDLGNEMEEFIVRMEDGRMCYLLAPLDRAEAVP